MKSCAEAAADSHCVGKNSRTTKEAHASTTCFSAPGLRAAYISLQRFFHTDLFGEKFGKNIKIFFTQALACSYLSIVHHINTERDMAINLTGHIDTLSG